MGVIFFRDADDNFLARVSPDRNFDFLPTMLVVGLDTRDIAIKLEGLFEKSMAAGSMADLEAGHKLEFDLNNLVNLHVRWSDDAIKNVNFGWR